MVCFLGLYPGTRDSIILSVLHRSCMKIISKLMTKPSSVQACFSHLDQLGVLARQGSSLPSSSLLVVEDRIRALSYFEADMNKIKQIDPSADDKNSLTSSVSPGSAAAGGGGGKSDKSKFSLAWKTDSKCRNVSFGEEDRAAMFNSNSSHRGIIANAGFDSGMYVCILEIARITRITRTNAFI